MNNFHAPSPLLALAGCLTAATVLAQSIPGNRPDIDLDLNRDGRTDFVLALRYWGFAPETPNQLHHLLKGSGSNQVWSVAASGRPATVDATGAWIPPIDGSQLWTQPPLEGFLLQDYLANGGDPRFGGGFIRRDGPLARNTEGWVDHPTPPTHLVVRFMTDTGWQLGWIRLMTFKYRGEPWWPGPFDTFPPIPPGTVRALDFGVAESTGTPTLVIGSNSTWPTSGLSLDRYVEPRDGTPYLRVRLSPARSWETLETAPSFDSTTWTEVGRQGAEAFIQLKRLDGPEDFSPRFFRLR